MRSVSAHLRSVAVSLSLSDFKSTAPFVFFVRSPHEVAMSEAELQM